MKSRLPRRLRATSYGREHDEHVRCAACGLPGHAALTCNREEGIALRGRALTLAEVSISLHHESRRSILRGVRSAVRRKLT